MKKTTLKRLVVFALAALQLVLGVSPFIPFVKNNIWAPATSVSQFASTLAAYIGIQLVCLSFLVALALIDFNENVTDALGQYTPLRVRRLKANEFYKDFLGGCIKAEHYVKICYLSPQPPDHGAPRERIAYYKRLVSVVKSNPNTAFKRIVRDSAANRQWVQTLIKQIDKTTNCSIAILKDSGELQAMPLALSVQIIDGTDAWLVAVAEHTGAEAYRDLAIANEHIAQMLDKYFDRLWGLSRVVFEPGFTEEQCRRAISMEN
jgi:hypothetical protein